MIKIFTKYRWIIIDENYGLYGTNSEELMKKASQFLLVYDLTTNLRVDDADSKEKIEEFTL
jgi:hypothetical protein